MRQDTDNNSKGAWVADHNGSLFDDHVKEMSADNYDNDTHRDNHPSLGLLPSFQTGRLAPRESHPSSDDTASPLSDPLLARRHKRLHSQPPFHLATYPLIVATPGDHNEADCLLISRARREDRLQAEAMWRLVRRGASLSLRIVLRVIKQFTRKHRSVQDGDLLCSASVGVISGSCYV